MRWRILTVLSLVAVLAALVAAPPPAIAADASAVGEKAVAFVANALTGWAVDCSKSHVDEWKKAESRAHVGQVLTGWIGCGVNVGARYISLVPDFFLIPTGKSVVPAIYEKPEPLISFPK